jgi:hypothetical protein
VPVLLLGARAIQVLHAARVFCFCACVHVPVRLPCACALDLLHAARFTLSCTCVPALVHAEGTRALALYVLRALLLHRRMHI